MVITVYTTVVVTVLKTRHVTNWLVTVTKDVNPDIPTHFATNVCKLFVYFSIFDSEKMISLNIQNSFKETFWRSVWIKWSLQTEYFSKFGILNLHYNLVVGKYKTMHSSFAPYISSVRTLCSILNPVFSKDRQLFFKV